MKQAVCALPSAPPRRLRAAGEDVGSLILTNDRPAAVACLSVSHDGETAASSVLGIADTQSCDRLRLYRGCQKRLFDIPGRF